MDLEQAALPGALRQMSLTEKQELAAAIRQRLLEVVPVTGGHLASNLGIVELTIGMYSVLDPFVDRIIWDVGHQAYVHKILTGRNAQFGTLRQENGLSGFPLRTESKADCFDTGHSSTSIAAAIGFARARDLRQEKHRVVAVIGDGAFGSGMAFEALNDAGRIFNNLIVILNDNGMSISPNVGGMSRYLRRIRTRKSYVCLKKGVKAFLMKIPKIGEAMVRRIKRFKASIRLLVIPGELFEELGWKYVGPIDGHDIEAVQSAIEKAEYLGGPVLIHAITKKGKGYEPAEKDPAAYHGISPEKSAFPSYSESFGSTLLEMAGEHPDIVAISAAMGSGTGLRSFSERFPERFFDVGIAEAHAITMACGLAAGGMRPFVGMYSTFMQRAYDSFLHDCALQKLPVTVVLDRAGVSGADGKTHQGIYDLAFLRTVPDVVVASPACIAEQKLLLRLAYEQEKPFVLRYPARDNYSFSTETFEREPVRLGAGVAVFENPHPEVLILSFGQMTEQAMQAAGILREQQIACTVFHARFLRPLDEKGIMKYFEDEKPRLVVTIEDGIRSGGFGSAVLDLLRRKPSALGIPVEIMGFPDEPIPHATISQLYRKYGLDGLGIAARVLSLLQGDSFL